MVWCFSPISLGRSEWWPKGFTIASMVLGPASVGLAWFAVRHLGKQWRIQAALSEDHELVQTGPYRWVRHPIYASMLGMLLATGFAKTWWPLPSPSRVFVPRYTAVKPARRGSRRRQART